MEPGKKNRLLSSISIHRNFHGDFQMGHLRILGFRTQAGDPEELQAISDVIAKAKGRQGPLLIGSVKVSNL